MIPPVSILDQVDITFVLWHRFQVTGLIEGQWYAYRVRALNKLGASRPCRATDEIQAVDARGGLFWTHPDRMLLFRAVSCSIPFTNLTKIFQQLLFEHFIKLQYI